MLRPNRDYAETTPKQIQTQRRIGRSGANQTGRNREKQPSASMGAAAKRPRLPRKRPMPDVVPPVGHRGLGNPDFSFGSPRKLRPICRQASPSGGDDRTIDQAPKRRFGMARHRWARGMAGHLRPGLPVDSTPRPAVSAQTDLECRSFGPSPARRPAQAMRHQSQRRPAPVGASESCFDCFAGASIPQLGIRQVRAGVGPKSPAERRNARITGSKRVAQVQARRGADRSPAFRATVARKHDPDQENANTRQTEPDRNNRRQSPIANGTSVWRRPSGQKPRAVRLASHSATPSLDLEMSKRCGAKPRIL